MFRELDSFAVRCHNCWRLTFEPVHVELGDEVLAVCEDCYDDFEAAIMGLACVCELGFAGCFAAAPRDFREVVAFGRAMWGAFIAFCSVCGRAARPWRLVEIEGERFCGECYESLIDAVEFKMLMDELDETIAEFEEVLKEYEEFFEVDGEKVSG